MQTKLTRLVLCQELMLSRGTCSNRLLETAALDKPGVLGWSGTVDRNISKWFLKRAKSPEFSFLRLLGKRLNILATRTPKDLSLAWLTLVGEVEGMALGMAILPLLSLHCQLMEYPSTRPWLTNHTYRVAGWLAPETMKLEK
jgi:hypothetical protein